MTRPRHVLLWVPDHIGLARRKEETVGSGYHGGDCLNAGSLPVCPIQFLREISFVEPPVSCRGRCAIADVVVFS